jgi:hypothetical protein
VAVVVPLATGVLWLWLCHWQGGCCGCAEKGLSVITVLHEAACSLAELVMSLIASLAEHLRPTEQPQPQHPSCQWVCYSRGSSTAEN